MCTAIIRRGQIVTRNGPVFYDPARQRVGHAQPNSTFLTGTHQAHHNLAKVDLRHVNQVVSTTTRQVLTTNNQYNILLYDDR